MATKLYTNFPAYTPTTTRGDKTNNQAGSAAWWIALPAETSWQNPSTTLLTTTTVAGPTGGIELISSALAYEWISPPLAAAATISGTISFSAYASESDMKANALMGCRIDKVAAADYALTTISTSVDDAELGTSAAVMTWTATPTSTAMAKGDRLRIVWYADDAVTMASGYTVTLLSPNPGSGSETSVSFDESLTFMTFSGAQYIYPTNTASDLSTADVDYKAWTSRGT